jgi:hypothetical protein
MEDLPLILAHFFVPRLEDKPQNPIMDALTLSTDNIKAHMTRELPIVSTISDLPHPQKRADNIWCEAITHNSGTRVGMSNLT